VWWLVLYTNAPVLSTTSFSDGAHVGWTSEGGASIPTDVGAPEGQTNYAWSFSASDSWPNSAPNGIQLGETVGGFSFTSNVFDSSAKRFVVDVVPDWGGGNLGLNREGDQIFSYGGYSVAAVPEPETYATMLTGLGLMGFVARRRKEIRA
jgi:hypothetical protein